MAALPVLALDIENGRTFSGCRENKGMSVVDVKTGKVITTLPIGAGVDAVAYDPETKLIFCSCGDGTVTIIKQLIADSYSVIQTLKTKPAPVLWHWIPKPIKYI